MPPSSDAPDQPEKPQHVVLVKGRWYWNPPKRLRKAIDIKTHALGADTATAWRLGDTLNKHHLPPDASAWPHGSVGWLLEKFLAQFAANDRKSPKTKQDYAWLAKVLRDMPLPNSPAMTFGKLMVLGLKPRHADAAYATLAKARGATSAHYACRFARRVWHWAARQEWATENPWVKMELPGVPKRKARFTPAQVAAVIDKAVEQGRPSIALATMLSYWLSWRESDVLAVTWQDLDAGRRVTQKTGAELPIPWRSYPDLRAAIEALPRPPLVVDAADGVAPPQQLVLREGKRGHRPYHQHTFCHEWRAVAEAAGIPATLEFRDLRATAMTELGDAEVTLAGMRTHGGHLTMEMAARYVRPTLAQAESAAAARMAARTTSGQKSKPASKRLNRTR